MQPDVLNGSISEMARFGTAIASIGDINKDSFNGTQYGTYRIDTIYVLNKTSSYRETLLTDPLSALQST